MAVAGNRVERVEQERNSQSSIQSVRQVGMGDPR
jgi:hypothetical protein